MILGLGSGLESVWIHDHNRRNKRVQKEGDDG